GVLQPTFFVCSFRWYTLYDHASPQKKPCSVLSPRVSTKTHLISISCNSPPPTSHFSTETTIGGDNHMQSTTVVVLNILCQERFLVYEIMENRRVTTMVTVDSIPCIRSENGTHQGKQKKTRKKKLKPSRKGKAIFYRLGTCTLLYREDAPVPIYVPELASTK
ncbi:hypothetical protein M8C21_001309, partial [Ambrosia artemisiifolia]